MKIIDIRFNILSRKRANVARVHFVSLAPLLLQPGDECVCTPHFLFFVRLVTKETQRRLLSETILNETVVMAEGDKAKINNTNYVMYS